jgi:hypothetical protein
MKIPKTLSNLITNKYVLYLVAGLAFFNVFSYMALGNINAVIFFILVGYIMTFFSKNMIIILAVPLILTNFLMVGMKIKEGLENANEDKDKKKSGNVILPLEDNVEGDVESDEPQSEEFKTQKQPVEYSDVDYSDNKKKGKTSGTRLDHGATVENAYDTLNKIIGGPGFSKMTDDTKRLMEQQQKLAQSMEQFGPMLDSIKPFLEKAQGLLGNMDIKGIAEMANKNKEPA